MIRYFRYDMQPYTYKPMHILTYLYLDMPVGPHLDIFVFEHAWAHMLDIYVDPYLDMPVFDHAGRPIFGHTVCGSLFGHACIWTCLWALMLDICVDPYLDMPVFEHACGPILGHYGMWALIWTCMHLNMPVGPYLDII